MSSSREVAAHDRNAHYEIDDALPMEPAKAAQLLLYLIAGLVVLTLVWASIAKLDRVRQEIKQDLLARPWVGNHIHTALLQIQLNRDACIGSG